nr:hypothetical protein [Tanacetum cinerariifolium]
MDTTQAQQKALDDALLAPANRLKIRKCNFCLISTLKSKEPTLQVVLDALKLTPSTKHLRSLPMYQKSTCKKAYKTYYACATGEKTSRPKYVQKKVDSETSPKKKPVQAPKGKRLKATAKVPKSGIHKGTGVSPGLLDVPTYGSDDEQISWKSSNDEDDDDADNQGDDDKDDDDADNQGDDAQDDDNEHTESDNDGDDFVHPKLSTFDEEERHNEKQDEEEEGSDLRVQTPSHFESTDDEA